jgi:hypothetical protein
MDHAALVSGADYRLDDVHANPYSEAETKMARNNVFRAISAL